MRRRCRSSACRSCWRPRGGAEVDLVEGKLRFRNVHGLELRAVPTFPHDEVELAQRWLGEREAELEGDHVPRWDGTRLDVDALLGWMAAAERAGC